MAEPEKSHKRNHSPESGTTQSPNTRQAKKVAFAERLSSLLKRLDLNDAELSRRSGLPKNTISRYRNAESLPEAHHLFTVAKTLGVNPEWLITGVGERMRSSDTSRRASDESRLVDLFNALDEEAKQFVLQTASLLWSRPAKDSPAQGPSAKPMLNDIQQDYKPRDTKG